MHSLMMAPRRRGLRGLRSVMRPFYANCPLAQINPTMWDSPVGARACNRQCSIFPEAVSGLIRLGPLPALPELFEDLLLPTVVPVPRLRDLDAVALAILPCIELSGKQRMIMHVELGVAGCSDLLHHLRG